MSKSHTKKMKFASLIGQKKFVRSTNFAEQIVLRSI
jgi:hypothetical protein